MIDNNRIAKMTGLWTKAWDGSQVAPDFARDPVAADALMTWLLDKRYDVAFFTDIEDEARECYIKRDGGRAGTFYGSHATWMAALADAANELFRETGASDAT